MAAHPPKVRSLGFPFSFVPGDKDMVGQVCCEGRWGITRYRHHPTWDGFTVDNMY